MQCSSGAFAIYKTTRIPNGLSSPDFSYDSSDLIIWTLYVPPLNRSYTHPTNLRPSVEGCSIIIACTIPVLSPLMEMIFKGHNPFHSTSRGQQYYGDMSDQHRTDLESGSTPRRPRRTFDDLDDTIVGGSDSQGLMRGKASKEMMITDTDSNGSSRSVSRPEVIRPPPNGILRTDEVTLTFDSDGSRSR